MRFQLVTRVSLLPLVISSVLSTPSLAETVSGTITVTGTREEVLKAETAETSDNLGQQEIQDTKPAHPAEIMERIPGVHINVTNGEGHMAAIRQPMTTKAVYLYLEDGIPTRSTGFFNHNALYEVNIPQASGIEVTKGPGTSLYGSDAIGGVVNVLTRPAPLQAEAEISLEAGEHSWQRVLMSGGNTFGDDGVRGDINVTHTDGWRDGTEYDRQSATVRWDRFMEDGSSLKTVLATSNIDQQTAGTSRLSEADYQDNPEINYYPISYREVQAVRLSTAYEKESKSTLLSLTPYVRHNFMDYMPNWSFGYDPSVQKTESNSLGLLAKYRIDFDTNRTRLIVGADIDYTPGEREEHTIDAIKTGNIFTSYTVNQLIYDYEVTYTGVSPYVHVETSPWDKWRLTAGLRYDNFEYDYDNQMADGLLSVNPASMSPRAANYNHPSDTTVDFSSLSPKLGATYQFSDKLNGFMSYRRAFRAPSEGQLFRPGGNAESLDLDAVKADSYEVGVRGEPGKTLSYELSVYFMSVKDDLVSYRDTTTNETITVNAGETLHKGIELGVNKDLTDQLELSASISYAEHIYEDWSKPVRIGGVWVNVDYSDNDIESAPNNISNMRLNYKPGLLNGGRVEVEWSHIGKYWMDQANTTKYDGHDLYNLRANYFVSKSFEIYTRVMNLGDEKYATAAALSSGNPQYAPGMPRTAYLGVDYKF